MKPGGKGAAPLAQFRHLHHGRRQSRQRTLRKHAGRPPCDCGGGVLVPVGGGAGNGNKGVPRLDIPRVIADPADLKSRASGSSSRVRKLILGHSRS